MKHISIIFFTAVALVSCAKQEAAITDDNSCGNFIEMGVSAASPYTKTAFGEKTEGLYPVLWSTEGESVRVYERVDESSWSAKNFSVNYEPSADLKTAQFKVNIKPQSADRFDYYVIYPGDGKTFQITTVDSPSQWLNTVRVANSGIQTPDAAGVDHKYTFLLGKKEGLDKQPSSIDVNFAHILGYAKMTVKNLPIPAGEEVSAIKITFNDRDYITGFIDCNVETGAVALTKSTSQSVGYVEIDPKNIDVNSTSFDVWFAMAPVELAAGESLSFTFTTSTGNLTHTTNLKDAMTFKSGIVTSFTIDAADAAVPTVLSFNLLDYVANIPTGVKTADACKQYFNIPAVDSNSGKTFYFRNAGGLYRSGTNAWTTLYDGSNTGYLGLPALPGYKLTKITATRGANSGATVTLEILEDIASKKAMTETVTWTKGSTTPAPIVIDGAKENTVYYIHALGTSYVPLGEISLEYNVALAEDAHSEYDVFLLLGDNNMLGRGETLAKTHCAPSTGVYTFGIDNTVLYGAQPLYNMQSTVRNGYGMHRFSLAGPFGEKVYELNGNKPVLLVSNARSGMSIDLWNSGASVQYYSEAAGDEPELYGMPIPNLFDAAVARALAAEAYGDIKAVIWHHGELDSSVEDAPLYLDKLKAFVSALRTALGKSADELPFICGELSSAEEGAARLNACLANVPSQIENSAVVSSLDCESNNNTAFFSINGLTTLGQRYAETYYDIVNK